jgi:hypothetical protein
MLLIIQIAGGIVLGGLALLLIFNKKLLGEPWEYFRRSIIDWSYGLRLLYQRN